MGEHPPLAFVDVETTGLDPRVNRIAEIGVVTVDGSVVSEWTSFVAPRSGDPSRRPRASLGSGYFPSAPAPSFADIAVELQQRLRGRILVAHNARFDYGFLTAEFQRVRLDLDCRVLCTVMLSRKLYPQQLGHDLDTLMHCHDLRAEERHRALPDARLLWQFWQVMWRERSREAIDSAITALLDGPVLPDQLDPALVDRLPDAPGVYAFMDRAGRTLHIGEADNLRLHVLDYFRLDRASAKALAVSHHIAKIDWRVTQGALGTRLLHVAWSNSRLPLKAAKRHCGLSWRMRPHDYPFASLVPIETAVGRGGGECFGMFPTERAARNALLRVARRHSLCHALLGISEAADAPCSACPGGGRLSACGKKTERLKHLVKAFGVLRPLRLPVWPAPGAIGIRERADLHIFDHWRYVGTARNDEEARETLQAPPREFDPRLHALLVRELARLPTHRVIDLAHLASDRST